MKVTKNGVTTEIQADAATRKRRRQAEQRRYDAAVRRFRRARTPEALYESLTAAKSRHGKCTDWIRENRRRRAAGVPQLRMIFGKVVDPMRKTINGSKYD